jgi:hypothetical protein
MFMKFWELTSAFRSEPDILRQVLSQNKWNDFYRKYKRLDEIVKTQQRDILDEELPFELCYEVAERSNLEFWLSFDEKPQVLYNYRPNIEYVERLTPIEILIRFGGDKIEDASERSSTDVQPRPLNGHVEVIGSYNLTSVGLLSILRTEKDGLARNGILSTIDEAKRWTVTKELKEMSLTPFSAYEKLEAQRKQNIRQYLLSGNGHSEKPGPGELLVIS